MNRARMRSMALAGVAVLGAAAVLTAGGQGMSGASLERQPAAAAERASFSSQPLGEVIREVIDLETGDRWLLLRDAANPGGPGRMVRVRNVETGSGVGAAESRTAGGGPADRRRTAASPNPCGRCTGCRGTYGGGGRAAGGSGSRICGRRSGVQGATKDRRQSGARGGAGCRAVRS